MAFPCKHRFVIKLKACRNDPLHKSEGLQSIHHFYAQNQNVVLNMLQMFLGFNVQDMMKINGKLYFVGDMYTLDLILT